MHGEEDVRQSDGNESDQHDVGGAVHQPRQKPIGNAALDQLILNHVIHWHRIHLQQQPCKSQLLSVKTMWAYVYLTDEDVGTCVFDC